MVIVRSDIHTVVVVSIGEIKEVSHFIIMFVIMVRFFLALIFLLVLVSLFECLV